jgi:hypothetical protein
MEKPEMPPESANEPRCLSCGYSLGGIFETTTTVVTCPECGVPNSRYDAYNPDGALDHGAIKSRRAALVFSLFTIVALALVIAVILRTLSNIDL